MTGLVAPDGHDVTVALWLGIAVAVWFATSVILACIIGPALGRMSQRHEAWEAEAAGDFEEPAPDVIDATILPLSQSETACRIRALMLGEQAERYLRDQDGVA